MTIGSRILAAAIVAVGVMGFAGTAQADIISVTDDGQALTSVGDEITGQFEFDGGVFVDYTLTLQAASGMDGSVYWNGGVGSEPSPNPGFSWSDVDNALEEWTVVLSFSQAVELTFTQGLTTDGWNHETTAFDFTWNSTEAPTISDPDGNLEDVSTGAGSASIGMNGTIKTPDDTWRLYGPASDEVTIRWYQTSGTLINSEWLTIVGSESFAVPVPEPGTWALMGLGLLGLASRRKRKVAIVAA